MKNNYKDSIDINLNLNNGVQYFEQQNELVLKILIYIYYYENALSEENIFINSQEKFYLIKPNWLKEFKNYFFYSTIKDKLESIDRYNRYINLL